MVPVQEGYIHATGGQANQQEGLADLELDWGGGFGEKLHGRLGSQGDEEGLQGGSVYGEGEGEVEEEEGEEEEEEDEDDSQILNPYWNVRDPAEDEVCGLALGRNSAPGALMMVVVMLVVMRMMMWKVPRACRAVLCDHE